MADTKLNYTLSLKDLFSKGMDRLFNKTKKLDGGMNRLNSSIRTFQNLATGGIIGAGLITFGKSVIDSLKNYEYFTAAIKTMLNGDALAAAALQGQLIQLAKTTPFSLNDVQDASKQLLAYGFKAGDLVKQMRLLGDASAGVGAPLGDIAYLYGTLKTSGRVMQVDLRQFAGRGIPIYEELAKVMGVNVQKVNQLVHEGKIGFKDVQKAFENMTAEGGHFFNLMNDQSKTIGGKLSNLGDVWEQLKVNIGRSQTGILSSTVNWVGEMVARLNDVVAASNRMDSVFKAAGKTVDELTFSKGEIFSDLVHDLLNPGGVLGTSKKNKMEMFDRSIQNMYVKPSGRDAVQAQGSLAEVLRLRSSFSKAFANKEIDKTEYERSYALLENAKKEILGNIKLFGTKENPLAKDPGTAAKEEAKGTDVTSARPQNLYITINDGLVHNMTIHTTTIKETASRVREEVGKVLLEAVNDVNNLGK